jgi:two-component system, NarL family, nitrate/nitrite response regulator NarL
MRVLVVEDQQLFAEALAATLREEGATIVGVAASGRAALASVQDECPDLVLMDLGLPDEDGLIIGREIMDLHPTVRVIALTSDRDPRFAREAFKAGFHGFLTKDARMRDVTSAIRSVMQGEVVIPRNVADRGSASGHTVGMLADQLTQRELEVLTLLTRGATSSSIANVLSISPNTVRSHVQNILAKLQVHSRLEAAAFAVHNGLVDPVSPPRRTDAA